MSEIVTPKLAGFCPYCNGSELVDHRSMGVRGTVQRCERSSCERYSLRKAGKQYPLAKPSDPESTPSTTAKV